MQCPFLWSSTWSLLRPLDFWSQTQDQEWCDLYLHNLGFVFQRVKYECDQRGSLGWLTSWAPSAPLLFSCQANGTECCCFQWSHTVCMAQSRFCTQPSLYQTQTIPGIYPVPSTHLGVCFPKPKKQNREHTDFLFLPCKIGKVQHTSG